MATYLAERGARLNRCRCDRHHDRLYAQNRAKGAGDQRRYAQPDTSHRSFDAILAWDSFFHLAADDQRAMFATFAAHAAPRAALMFTSGHMAGEAIGEVAESRSITPPSPPPNTTRCWRTSGFKVLRYTPEDPTCGQSYRSGWHNSPAAERANDSHCIAHCRHNARTSFGGGKKRAILRFRQKPRFDQNAGKICSSQHSQLAFAPGPRIHRHIRRPHCRDQIIGNPFALRPRAGAGQIHQRGRHAIIRVVQINTCQKITTLVPFDNACPAASPPSDDNV